MQVVFQKGESLEYTAARDFGLNFEDRSIKSVKIRTGESVFYDGEIARYRKSSGEEIFGRCPSLKSAINVMGWLILKDSKRLSKKSNVIEDSPKVIPNQGDYDGLKGGSFDSFAARNNSGVYVAPLPPKMAVIKEQDRVVKEFHSLTKPENTPKLPAEKLDVSKDQVEVKKGFIVNSSTSVNKETKRDMPIVRRDEMGSERVTPIEGIKPPVSKGTKKASFVLDEKTPLTIPEDMTRNEVEKMKTIPAEESQNATIVKKIGSTMIVQEVDGITMRKKTQEGITLTNNISSADREIIFTAKVTPGGEAITTIQDEGKIVSKIPSIENRDANAAVRAAERAAARKTAAKNTQAMMEKEKQPLKEIPVVVKAAEPENIPEIEETDVKKYIELLPQDWGKMHWTKKEAFIMACDNKALILFIRSMETARAIVNACLIRLKELEQAI